jgi:cation diffusion facilitator CzcD-associated flavoprotein CzcO
MSLAALEARLAHDLASINMGAPDWLAPRAHPDGHVYDVAIVGGGQSGLGAAFGLQRERISNLIVLDESPAGYEGPWETYARMATLRTAKHLNSIDFHLPSLTYRAWWEAQHGLEAWDAVEKIARHDWMAYLRWYRRVLALPMRNGACVALIEPLGGTQGGLHRLHLASGEALLARKVVLATGLQGGGEWHVPPLVAEALPTHRYAHTADDIDYAALAGKRVAILGGGASAFDNACAALETGAVAAHVFQRRKAIPRINPIRFMQTAGILARYPTLGDDEKYALMATFFAHNMPPTVDMFERAAALPGFDLVLGAAWRSVREVDGEIEIETALGRHRYDFLILSTGVVNDAALRPELRLVHERIARWGDRYAPRRDLANSAIDAHPYLGNGFELQPRNAEDAALLHGLFAFNYSALVSIGVSASAVSGLAHALPWLVKGVADQLFRDDAEPILAAFQAHAEPEFTAVWPREAAA